jgi:NAD(P)-dependent dehydrogenase (short-subunit alcohol dehydrogenase family)
VPEPTQPNLRYTGRRVLVTGAGSGIGQACVLRILAEGGTVVAADISPDGLADTVSRAGDGGRLSTVAMDVADEDSVRAGVAKAVSTLGGLDTLVNAAGILRSAHLEQTTLADFEQVLRINLTGTFLVTRESIGALKAGVNPAVVNFSSTSAHFAHPYMAAYAASKGGVLAMTHTWALEPVQFGSARLDLVGYDRRHRRLAAECRPRVARRRRLLVVRQGAADAAAGGRRHLRRAGGSRRGGRDAGL